MTPIWESRDKMTFGCWPYGQTYKILWGGRWWLPPSLGRGEFCESVFTRGSSMHQKCSNYALTNLLFGLCKSMWIIELLVTLPSPNPGAPTCPSTSKCCELGNMPRLLILLLFSYLYLQLNLLRSLGVCQGRWRACQLVVLFWICVCVCVCFFFLNCIKRWWVGRLVIIFCNVRKKKKKKQRRDTFIVVFCLGFI
jgi:hypothetical protein